MSTKPASRTTQARLVTADELLELPDDGFRYELVRGELKKMAPAGDERGIVAMDIGTSLNVHVKAKKLGRVYAAETGFKLGSNPDTVRAADVAFVSNERLAKKPGLVKGYRAVAPDLIAEIVEVVSPHDRHSKVMEKVSTWLGVGTRMVLVLDPERRAVTVYRSLQDIHVLSEDDIIDGADVVPGWTLPLRELFG
jgi:Uma2 family endonuclease